MSNLSNFTPTHPNSFDFVAVEKMLLSLGFKHQTTESYTHTECSPLVATTLFSELRFYNDKGRLFQCPFETTFEYLYEQLCKKGYAGVIIPYCRRTKIGNIFDDE